VEPLPTLSWRYFVIEANRDLGWKCFDRGPAGEAVVGTGIGCGMTMIGDLGGPCPDPSCATAAVVTVDVMSKRVTSLYFILILLGRSGRHDADDVRTQSVGNIAGFRFREKAPHQVSVAGDCRLSLLS
jgi:hypothetical protein